MVVAVGDILEPVTEAASVPLGLYEVVAIEGDDILLSRLHTNEDGRLGTSGRNSWIARSEIGSFRLVRVTGGLRP
jgi:hypothetical protein